MTTREPQCVAFKRHGAKYVGQLLAGKSKQEELEFWDSILKVYVLGKSPNQRNLSKVLSSTSRSTSVILRSGSHHPTITAKRQPRAMSASGLYRPA